jgi:hypothetical protein
VAKGLAATFILLVNCALGQIEALDPVIVSATRSPYLGDSRIETAHSAMGVYNFSAGRMLGLGARVRW